jgi:hypothetical protein
MTEKLLCVQSLSPYVCEQDTRGASKRRLVYFKWLPFDPLFALKRSLQARMPALQEALRAINRQVTTFPAGKSLLTAVDKNCLIEELAVARGRAKAVSSFPATIAPEKGKPAARQGRKAKSLR